MTTVAYRNGVMAADSSCHADGTSTYGVRKLFRLNDGSIIGFAGSLTGWLKFLDWLDNDGADEDRPSGQDVSAIRVSPKGRVTLYESGVAIRPRAGKYFAIGSGLDVALGAMCVGASATAAVRAAVKHDLGTIAPVISMSLKGNK